LPRESGIPRSEVGTEWKASASRCVVAKAGGHCRGCPAGHLSTPLVPQSWGEKRGLRDTLRLPSDPLRFSATLLWGEEKRGIWGHPRPRQRAAAPVLSFPRRRESTCRVGRGTQNPPAPSSCPSSTPLIPIPPLTKGDAGGFRRTGDSPETPAGTRSIKIPPLGWRSWWLSSMAALCHFL